ncbi:phospholipase D1-like [Ctenocephalides felis]|uniref:phospholipase D1-like n=1 Tax=Ctenocephalides felis TaxID=7515 RepID=UPI000E6E4444|nr:phospholipase D1-like [Ctenocephalides felis]
MLNPNLYTILLQHGEFKWEIRKRYKHFQHLHQQLRLFRASLNIPFPTKTHKERRTSFKNTLNSHMLGTETNKVKTKRRRGALPRFPNRPEALVGEEGLQNRMRQLEDYLYNLLNISFYRNHHETVAFLEVSNLSFIRDLGDKGKEGMVLKRTGSTQPGQSGCTCCGLAQNTVCVRCNYFCTDVICAKWKTRWFFAKDSCFGYIRPEDGTVRSVMLFDQSFEVSSGMYSTGLRNGLQIINSNRQMVIKLWTRRKAREWMNHLKIIANNEARDFTSPNPHGSFAPVRNAISSRWYADASDYMCHVADALDGAKEEIFIADWWLTPEIYMKRPALSGDYWRLDKILKRKSKQGVKIFVLLYKEVEMALGINSYYSKQKLVEDSDIKVIRHPDHASAGVLLWAHHEKLVCVDQSIAFLGGIDLCYGRWDDHKHRLTDMGSVSQSATLQNNGKSLLDRTNSSSTSKISFSGKNFPNMTPTGNRNSTILSLAESTKDISAAFVNTVSSESSSVDKLPVLEPGDKLLITKPPDKFTSPDDRLMMLSGEKRPSFLEKQQPKCNTPEAQRKNVLEKIKDKGKDLIHMFNTDHDLDAKNLDKNLFYTQNEQISDSPGGQKGDQKSKKKLSKKNEHDEFVNSLDGQAKYWIGKDYCNFIIKDFENLDLPYVDLVDRCTTPRMPWHDIAVSICGSAARDAARHFIQRWNVCKFEKQRENPSYPYLLPKSYRDWAWSQDLEDEFEKIVGEGAYKVTCQVLRSASCWSCGFLEHDQVEQSIHEAYVQTISRAQHYIYIENQFFITLAMGNDSRVKNQIGEALYKRIMRAHRENAVFRVYVVMPLLPAFEGEIGAPSGASLHAITHYNYASISRGKDSLIQRLKDSGIEHPEDYVSFHGLRTHGALPIDGAPVTELVYVHSKLLIADDKTVICGSANINDRSMLGIRDSEMAVIIQDEAFEEGTMNGEVFPCGVYAGSLRKHLFKEHLGLLDSDQDHLRYDITDATHDAFWHDVWRRVSRDNTETHEAVFRCLPTDQVKDFKELARYQRVEVGQALAKLEPARAAHVCYTHLQGNLVDFPLNFLANEVLTPSGYSKEGMLPTSIWT